MEQRLTLLHSRVQSSYFHTRPRPPTRVAACQHNRHEHGLGVLPPRGLHPLTIALLPLWHSYFEWSAGESDGKCRLRPFSTDGNSRLGAAIGRGTFVDECCLT